MDHENTVKAYSASPSMLGRGHSLVEPQGPVWVYSLNYRNPSVYLTRGLKFLQSVHSSDFHPQLAVGATDGTCSTTNTLRRTRRGGSVVCVF
jgi:transcription factor C subunit 6